MKHLNLIFFLFFLTFSSALFAQVSVVDGIGRTVTVKNVPKRIVSLAPSATEILFAVGAQNQIIARTDYCDYPIEAQKLASIGGFDGKTFSLEKILSFRPDFVYAYAGMHDHLVGPLERYGIPVFVSDVKTVTDTLEEIRKIALISGHSETGKKLAANLQAQITAVTAKIADQKPKTVYWEVWNLPFMSVGNSSYIHDVIRVSGGTNIFFDVGQAYPVVSEESIIARNPQFIFLSHDSPVSVENVKNRPGWQFIEAVKKGEIHKINADLVSRPSPRIAEAIELVAGILRK